MTTTPSTNKPKRDREPAEIGAMSRRVFRALVRRAGDGDIEALRELVALQDQLRNAITDAGRELHDFGFSFTYLAAETGVTRQAARKRYRPAHHFDDPTGDTAEICACGAAFVEGYNLQAMKTAHLSAHAAVSCRP